MHHSDRGSQYVSIHYTERLAQADIEPSVGSAGDSYNNALAESTNGLYKAGVINRCAPWRSLEAVRSAILEWVDWFNHRRLLDLTGNISATEAESLYYAARTFCSWQHDLNQTASGKTGTVHRNPVAILSTISHQRRELSIGLDTFTGARQSPSAPSRVSSVTESTPVRRYHPIQGKGLTRCQPAGTQ